MARREAAAGVRARAAADNHETSRQGHDMTTPNVALLQQTLNYIKDNPETWEQANWCGTSQCFAGWAVTLAGMRVNDLRETVAVADMPSELAAEVDPDDEEITVREAAVIALGIADLELPDIDDEYPDIEPELISAASVLFYSGNTLEDLEHWVAELCATTPETTAS
jgi:hypothetical protein